MTVIDREGTELVWAVGGEGTPDLVAVDAVARFALLVRRGGAVIELSDLSPEMRELLDISGLEVELRPRAGETG